MEPLLENGWFDEEEEAATGSEVDDSDIGDETEAVLYSLVHHKPQSDEEFDPSNANVRTDVSEPSYSISKRSKASRWDRVKRITESGNSGRNIVTSSSDIVPKIMYNSQENVKSVPDFIQIMPDQSSEHMSLGSTNAVNRSICTNNEAMSHESQSRIECDQSDSAKQGSSVNSSPNKPKPNLRAVLESLAGYPSTVILRENKKKKKKERNKDNSTTQVTSSDVLDNRTSGVVQNSVVNSSSKSDQEVNDRKSTSADNGDRVIIDSPSKYSIELTNTKSPIKGQNGLLNTSIDVIELIADSDLESDASAESIVVVEAPPKSPPPLIDLEESPDERGNNAKSVSLNVVTTPPAGPSIQPANDLIIHCSPSGPQASLNTDVTLDNSVIVISDSPENTGKRKKQKKGKKKKKRRTQSPVTAENQSSPSSLPHVSDCYSWTPDMARFYNEPWGCRDLDVIRKKMSGHFRHWKILEVDRYGPRRRTGPLAKVRCRNCNQLGHQAGHCPDPIKKPICYMCGQTGHREPRCPNKICLKCGRPSSLYTEGCSICSAPGSDPCICTTCRKIGHYFYQCPTAWRGFHLVTTPDLSNVSPGSIYKPAKKLYCCICARRGHSAHECLGNASLAPFSSVAIPGLPPINAAPVVGPLDMAPSVFSRNNALYEGVLQNQTKLSRRERKQARLQKKQMQMFHGIEHGGGRRKKKVGFYRESYINYTRIS